MARKKPRRRAAEDDGKAPLSGPFEGTNKIAIQAYWMALWAMIPIAGLFLGPVAAVLGGVARYRGRTDATFKFQLPALAAVVIGGLSGVANWLGLAFILVGLHSMGVF